MSGTLANMTSLCDVEHDRLGRRVSEICSKISDNALPVKAFKNGAGTRHLTDEIGGVGSSRSSSSIAARSIRKWPRPISDRLALIRQPLRLGFLGTLELVDRPGPPPTLAECLWHADYIPYCSTLARHILEFRVPGTLVDAQTRAWRKPNTCSANEEQLR